MKKNNEIPSAIIEEEKKSIPQKRTPARKRIVRTVEEAIAGASGREHELHKKALAAWEKTSYKVPQSLMELLKEKKERKKQEQRESHIQFAEQIKELDAHIHLASCITKLEQGSELVQEEREILASALEQRGWQKILHNAQPGDTLVSVLVPNDAHMSVKHFNDVVFGPQKTDLIIAYRKEALREVMESAGLALLGQGYKDAYVRVPRGGAGDMRNMHGLVQEVNHLVNERIIKMLDEAQKETRRSGDEKKVRAIEELKKTLTAPETSYKMTFGTSKVGAQETQGDYSHIEVAITNSMKAAIVAREERLQGICGLDSSADRARVMEYVGQIRQMRETFIRRSENGAFQDSQEIQDNQGHSFFIMEPHEDGTLQMNLELIRDIRKGKFIPATQDETLFQDIQQYIKRINILDVIKPFVHEELAGEHVYGTGETLQSRIQFQADAIETLRAGRPIPLDDQKEISAILKSEAKDQTCTSAAEFHEKSLAIEQCTYISMDVLDVGPRLLQEFDRLLQKVEQGGMTLEQAGMIAGDATTRQMREFRRTVTDLYQSMTGLSERPLMQVGGDEAILAMDSALVTDELLIALREKTGSRVVKSVVSLSERSSAGMSDMTKKQEHLLAQQRAEQGIDRAKKNERSLGAVRLDIESLPLHFQEKYEQDIKNLHLDQYAVSQYVDGSSLLVRKEAPLIICDAIEKEIQNIQTAVTEQFTKEMIRLQKQGYGEVREENIKQLMRMQRDLAQRFGDERGEVLFEKFLETHYRT